MDDFDVPGTSHWRPAVNLVSGKESFDNILENLAYKVLLEEPSEPYDSDKDPYYRSDNEHDSESEQEDDENNESSEQSVEGTNFFYRGNKL